MNQHATECPLHLKFFEQIDVTPIARAAIGSDGTIGVLVWGVAKLRCEECGEVEIVPTAATNFALAEFHVHPEGLAIIARTLGLKLVPAVLPPLSPITPAAPEVPR